MLQNRHRGLANLHNTCALVAGSALFWGYSRLIIAYWSDWIRVTPDSRLLPYFLSVVVGFLLSWGQVMRRTDRLPWLDWDEAASLAARQTAIIAGVMFSLMFATQDRSVSRLFLGSFLVFSWVGLTFLHLRLPRRLARLFFGRGQQVPTLFIGHPQALAGVGAWVAERAHLGVQAVGAVTLDPDPAVILPPGTRQLKDLPALLAEQQVAQVILMEIPEKDEQTRQILESCQAQGCRLLLRHDLQVRLGHPVVAVEQGGQYFFTLHEEPLEEPLNRAIKRGFDVLVALPVVIIILPVLCGMVGFMQWRQSPGPLLYVRRRSGAQRAEFPMLKFRTMHVSRPDPQAEGRQASRGDERVYPFGRFLRRHSLDEFPQFWNVLFGEMSIVGPRPVMPLLDAEFERQSRVYRTRHFVKPGITGLAQSEGFRGAITTNEQLQERIRLDLHYITQWTIWLDIRVTVRTLTQVFRPPPGAF